MAFKGNLLQLSDLLTDRKDRSGKAVYFVRMDCFTPQIDEILGSKFEDKKNATREDIQGFVYTFVLAKYRLSLTSNSEEFTKILLQSMSENNIADMDAGRFCNIIDGINLDALDKKENIYKFAEATKTEIQKIMSGEKINPTEILKDIEQILNTGAEEEEETSDVEDIF
jgi:hypothetical protein